MEINLYSVPGTERQPCISVVLIGSLSYFSASLVSALLSGQDFSSFGAEVLPWSCQSALEHHSPSRVPPTSCQTLLLASLNITCSRVPHCYASSTCSATHLPMILFSGHYALPTQLVPPKCLFPKHPRLLQRQVFSLWSFILTEGLFCHFLTFLLTGKKVARKKGWVRNSVLLMKWPILFSCWFKGILGVGCIRDSCNKQLCIGRGMFRRMLLYIKFATWGLSLLDGNCFTNLSPWITSLAQYQPGMLS